MKRNIFVTKTMEIIYIIIYIVIGTGFSYRIFFELRKLIEKIVTYLVCPCMSRSDPFTAIVFDLKKKKIGG